MKNTVLGKIKPVSNEGQKEYRIAESVVVGQVRDGNSRMIFKDSVLCAQFLREKCVERVKERNMGYLFANMEKMDIQEERRKTAEARKEAEEAKAQAKEAKTQAEAAHNEAIKNTVLLCRKLGASKETAVQELVNLYGMELTAAQEKVALYWDCPELNHQL